MESADAELLYQDACEQEHPMANLGAIEWHCQLTIFDDESLLWGSYVHD
ncbi:MAG: hypothetical protein AAF827_00115 [Cyanobacteria bacterium P01_D01_bin.6]